MKKLKGPALNNVNKNSKNSAKLSAAETSIIKLRLSQKYGLKKTALIILGETLNKPIGVGFISPRLKKEPPSSSVLESWE
ncbi:MAG: hypothetical protein IPJ81_03480 [Chitinophagaceae bacterium]|nr:hypothetical protein [Chitinophagaceae bacterium]